MKRFFRYLIALGMAALLVTVALAADPTQVDSLSVSQAESLVTRKGPLALNNLKTLPAEVAAVLARHEGELSLNGLTDLSPEAAAALARHKAVEAFGRADLSLNRLTAVSTAAAEALASHRGTLALHGLQTLDSVPLARKLAAQWGELHLGLTSLSPEIAAELAKNEGVFEDRSRPGVVERRGDFAPSILRLDNLQALSPEAAAALSKHQGILVLNDLTTLDPAAARELAKRRGGRVNPTRLGLTLVLNGLTALSTETAAALAMCQGEVVLRAVTELPAGAAEALARSQAVFYLTGLKTIAPDVQAVLREHPKIRLPRGF
jgi:hypothetical protein